MKTITMRVLPALVLLLAGVSAQGETVTYRGMGTYQVIRTLMPLANGGAAIHLSNDIVATIEPSESGFIFGDCAGIGFLSPESRYSAQLYCTFTETGNDAFDLKAVMDDQHGTIEIIGGSGKWQGATGAGSVKPKYAEGDRGSYEYEFKITTP